MSLPTSRDIATEAHVAQATVSRVINNHPSVRPETRERVLAAIKRLNYAPNETARSLITRRTRTVGVVVSDITNPFYPALIESLAGYLTAAGYRMVLWNMRANAGAQLLHALSHHLVDGMISTASTVNSQEMAQVVDAGYPVVLLNRYVDAIACDAVYTDNEAGACAIADHLFALGHRRIGLIAGPLNTSTARDREGAFRYRLDELCIPFPADSIVRGDFSHDSGSHCMRQLLNRSADERVTAVFAVNDAMAIGALNAAIEQGIAVPQDVSVVGFDDSPMARWPAFRLTTVRQPVDEMARWGVERVIARVDDPSLPHQRHIFPSALIVRATTGAPGVQDFERSA